MNREEFERLNKINDAEDVVGKSYSKLYSICISIGLAIFFYIYIYDFNSFSETKLIRITPVWMFPLIFGIYGFMAQSLFSPRDSKYHDVSELLMKKSDFNKFFLPFFPILFMPFFFIKSREPLKVALIGSVIWLGFMVFFFEAIFPAL